MSRHTQTDALPRRADRRTSSAVVALAVALGLVGSGALVWRGTEAVFTAQTENGPNSWQTGSVEITDNDGATALFALPKVGPGVGTDRCINVTYAGSLTPKGVKLYAKGYTNSADGTLGTNVRLTISEGTGTIGATLDCTNFSGGTVIYNGTLAGFGALTDWESGVGAWVPTTGQTRAYKIGYEVLPDAGQLQTTRLTFVWEAQA